MNFKTFSKREREREKERKWIGIEHISGCELKEKPIKNKEIKKNIFRNHRKCDYSLYRNGDNKVKYISALSRTKALNKPVKCL